MNTSLVSHKVGPTDVAIARTTGRFARAGLVAGLCAAVVNLAVVAIAHASDVSFEIRGERIPLVAFPEVTVFATLIGVALAAVLVRRARRPRSVFLIVTIALSALSLLPPVLVDTDTATRLMLELTHLVAAFIIIPAIASRLAD
jgi:peptidoglycan/LPS O-acetylase OafA/YrhL